MLETIHSEHHSSSLLISLPQSTLWTEDRWMCQLCWSYQDTCLSDRLRSRTVHRVCCSLLYLLNGNAWYDETLQVSHTQPPPQGCIVTVLRGGKQELMAGRPRRSLLYSGPLMKDVYIFKLFWCCLIYRPIDYAVKMLGSARKRCVYHKWLIEAGQEFGLIFKALGSFVLLCVKEQVERGKIKKFKGS